MCQMSEKFYTYFFLSLTSIFIRCYNWIIKIGRTPLRKESEKKKL